MSIKDGKFPKVLELPICPFCDGRIFYTAWVTHKIYQMECERCGAHWRTGIKRSPQREMYVELTKPMHNSHGREFLYRKLSMAFWRDMIRTRIRI